MRNYQQIIDIANCLINAVDIRDNIRMQELVEQLDKAYQTEYGDRIDCYKAFYAFVLMNLASARYFSFNNMYGQVHERYKEVEERMSGFRQSQDYSTEEKATVDRLFDSLVEIHKATPEKHQNLVIPRYDTRCCLCRVLPANKTGSHMVPNFLSHPTFSWDGKGKRFHEALNHDYLNAADLNCQFYGREVPEWRFAQGEGKTEVTEEDIAKNINQLEYDNEFCSGCEDRFGILESAYAQYYNGQKKSIHPRVAYLFWLSVLWRMSMGSMSIFMDMNDELPLRRMLDESILGTIKEIEDGNSNLGEWKYAIFRIQGLKDGDKGILGYRKESSPYVVMYNDLVMVFFHNNPSDEELSLGPIQVYRNQLNDWQNPEKLTFADRRWFIDVRDWIVETSYDYLDPIREKTLRSIREKERSDDAVIDESCKKKAIKIARLSEPPQPKIIRLHKMQRIYIAWIRLNEASEKGETYDPLHDEDLFLQQRDFELYYSDLANMSRHSEYHDKVPEFPFYEEARKAIPDPQEWDIAHDEGMIDSEYLNAFKEFTSTLKPKEIDHLINGVQEPYINPYKGIGRNDPCPCGSGKKFKKCCGRH